MHGARQSKDAVYHEMQASGNGGLNSGNNEKASPHLTRFFQQFRALFYKNFLTFKRRWMLSLILILAPSLIIVTSLIVAKLVNHAETQQDIFDIVFFYSYSSLNVLMAIVLSVMYLYVIVTEKNSKVTAFIRNTGLIESAYWMTWLAADLILCFIGSFVATATGYICDVALFTRVDFVVHLLIQFVYLGSSLTFAFIFAACMSKPTYINLVMVVGILIFFISTPFMNPYGPGTWSGQLQSDSGFVQVVMFLLPWVYWEYNLSSIVLKTSADELVFDWSHNATELLGDRHFKTKDLTTHLPLMEDWCWDYNGYSYSSSSTFDCAEDPNTVLRMLGLQLLQCVVFLFLCWYLAQTIGGGGGDRRWWYLFDKQYWGYENINKEMNVDDTIAMEQLHSRNDNTIRCKKVSKSYEKVSAVKEVTLQFETGKITAILGPNGAGKSTLMGVLTGMFAPTHGHAFLQGLDVRTDLDLIHRKVGICYQHNPLWDHLTAREHLSVIATFRGLPENEKEAAIDEALTLFRLEKVKVPTSGYSGGMKRRLLIAMSVVGSPDIVFLDEPTTGMDPLNRRLTWNALQTLKKRMLILLITHSMEEADYLCDEIAIMINGGLRCKGTSLYLKERYGIGYQLKFSVDPRYMAPIRDVIHVLLPTAEFMDSVQTAGEILISLPKTDKDLLPDFFLWLEQHAELAKERNVKIVKEWGISNSTLEDVFMRFTTANTGVNEEIVAGSETAVQRCQLCRIRDANTVKMFTAKSVNGRQVLVKNHVCQECWTTDQREPDENDLVVEKVSDDDSKALGRATHITPQGYDLLDPMFLFNLPIANKPLEEGKTGADADVAAVKVNVTEEERAEEEAAIAAQALKPVSGYHQARAVFLHNMTLLSRQKKANIARFVVLAILMLVFGLSTNKNNLYDSASACVFLACFFWPVASGVIAADRRETTLHMLTISGMRMGPYVMGQLAFYFTVTFIWSSIMPLLFLLVVPGVSAKILQWIGLNVIWAFSLSAMALLQGSVFTGKVLSDIISWLLIVVNLSLLQFITTKGLPLPAAIYPPIAYNQALNIITGFWGTNPTFRTHQLLDFPTIIVIMLCQAVASTFLAFIIIGVRNYGFDRCIELIYVTFGAAHSDQQDVAIDTLRHSLMGVSDTIDDVDVVQERDRVKDPKLRTPQKAGMCLNDLTKVYAGGKMAVNAVSMAIDYGQTFALLGPNGAGKSTMVSILSGLLSATRGGVYVGGFNMLRQSELLYRLLGVCPQHDVVYDDATVREHLLLYCRVKGVPLNQEEARVRNIAEHMQLDGDSFNMIASTLSGGQKRRLSIGISLVGDPRVWVLDEPTTGLDPDVRRVVWNIIQKKKSAQRATLITSHAMDEAEVLCDHIGIVSQGRLKCIGTPLHLKHRFGGGFKLSITMKRHSDADSSITAQEDTKIQPALNANATDQDSHAYMDTFIHEHLTPEAERIYLMGPTRSYRIPTSVKISKVFQILEKQKEELNMRDWAISHSSLEEVFIKIVEEDETTGA